MKQYLLFLVLLVSSIPVLSGFSWAQCPEDPIDLGVCDTFTVVAWDERECDSFPCLVHLSLLVSHDSNTFYWEQQGRWVQDSITSFIIPLTWTHTNSSAYCSLSREKNTASYTDTANSIFRHFGGMHNRMLDLYEMGQGLEWSANLEIYNYDPSHPDRRPYFGMYTIASQSTSRRWGEGDRVLLATLTFTVSDTMTICVDTLIGPICMSSFTRYDAVDYVPRDNMPLCMTVKFFNRGDANGNGEVHIEDIVYLINYLFINGPPPPALRAGDANCDGVISIADVVYLINYLFAGGPPPGCW